MAQGIYPDYPPELPETSHQYLLTNLKDWSISYGLAVRPATSFVPLNQDPELSLATTAPVTLFPSLISRSCFEQGLAIQTAYNKLYSAIARDEAWLQPIIEEYVLSVVASYFFPKLVSPSLYNFLPFVASQAYIIFWKSLASHIECFLLYTPNAIVLCGKYNYPILDL
jgi:hypothetical protein